MVDNDRTKPADDQERSYGCALGWLNRLTSSILPLRSMRRSAYPCSPMKTLWSELQLFIAAALILLAGFIVATYDRFTGKDDDE